MNEFIVESKGHCFLCLNIISADLGQFSSFHYLARYLHLDMGKVFHEGGHDVSPKLLDKVQKSKMKAELCGECAALNNSFSVAHQQLEKIQLEVRYKLHLVHQRMQTAEYQTITMLSKMVVGGYNSENDDKELAAKLKITDVLRNETLDKCSHKLSKTKPRVKVQKLTPDELLRIEEAKSKYECQQLAKPGLDMDPVIKTESIGSDMDTTSERDHDDNYLTGFDNDDSEHKPTHLIMNPEVDDIHSYTDIKPKLKRKLSGKGKARQGQYKCTKCDKSYTLRQNLRIHQLAIHTGKKFPCGYCGKKFNIRANLDRHIQTIHLGKRFCCKFCSKTFSQLCKRNLHMKTKCPNRKLNQ